MNEETLLEKFNNLTEQELIELYGEIPTNIINKPNDYSIKSAIDGSLKEDSEVILDEINN